MPRKPRIDIPGYYHVINRGVNRQPVFLENEDKEIFLDFLERSRDNYQFTVGFYPDFTDTSKKPIVVTRSVYVEEKKIQRRI